MNFLKKKRGGDKLISMYWFLVLTIIAGGIVMMVNVFYGSPYDVRVAESEILSMKIADCLSHGGEMNKGLIGVTGSFKPEFQDNFLNWCKLNFDVRGEFDPGEYYVSVSFFNIKNLKKSVWNITAGNKNWIADCHLDDDSEKIVKCVEKEFFSKDSSDRTYLIKILTIVRNTEKNVK